VDAGFYMVERRPARVSACGSARVSDRRQADCCMPRAARAVPAGAGTRTRCLRWGWSN